MKKIYLFFPAFLFSLGLLARTPESSVQRTGDFEIDKVNSVAEQIPDLKKGKDMELTTLSFTNSGSWICPPGVFEITVEAWGAGGRGGSRTNNGVAGGGGGGAFSKGKVIVVPDIKYDIVVGKGATTAYPGGDSYFGDGSLVYAKGGSSVSDNSQSGAQGGQANAGYGEIRYSGGKGADGTNNRSGGGGGGAGTGGNGGDANGTTAGAGAAELGGAGGAGRTSAGNGNNGNKHGGGGGGTIRSSGWFGGGGSGGSGADGLVRINYYVSATFTDPEGANIFVVPDGVEIISVEAWGGGGGGGADNRNFGEGGGGGGGGAYSKQILGVKPGEQYRVIVGKGGHGQMGTSESKTGEASAFMGPDSSNDVLVRAVGGKGVADLGIHGAAGGLWNEGLGEQRYSGGKGADGNPGFFGLAPGSGGGGGAGGPNGDGNNAYRTTGGTGRYPGGNGGNGTQRFINPVGGESGKDYGGGGSGGMSGLSGGLIFGGNGADGAVEIKWDVVKCKVEVETLLSQSSTTPEIDPETQIQYFNICKNDSLELRADAKCDNCQTTFYQWFFSDSNIEPTSGNNYIFDDLNKSIEGTLVVNGNNGQCYDSQRFRIRVSEGPVVNFGKDPELCAGVEELISIGQPEENPDEKKNHITVRPFFETDPFEFSVPIEHSSLEWNGHKIEGFPDAEATVSPNPGALGEISLGVLTVKDDFGCKTTFNYVKNVDGVPEEVRGEMESGDFLWSGYNNQTWNDYGTGGNWLLKTDSVSDFGFGSVVPDSTANIFIADYCRTKHMPHSSGNIVSKNITIFSGASFDLEENQTFTIHGNFTNEGSFNAGPGSTVIFSGSELQEVRTGGTGVGRDFERLIINKTSKNEAPNRVKLVGDDMRIKNTLTLSEGILETGENLRVEVTNESPEALTVGNAASYIFGNLRRYVAQDGNTPYSFPMGTNSNYRLTQIENYNLPGIEYIDAKFITPFDQGTINASDFGVSYSSIDPAGIWELTPDATPTQGVSYDIKLWFDDGVFELEDNKFGVVKRQNTSADWVGEAPDGSGGYLDTLGGLGRLTEDGFALRHELSSFSQFGIGRSNEILPIELLSFTATYRKPDVILEWATATEINNDYFTLERSKDLEDSEVIGYVEGAGNSSQTLWYSFTDFMPLSGVSYYRLKQTDFDGKSEHSDWVVVDTGTGLDGLRVVVRTLAQGHTLQIFHPGGQLQVEVTDLLGRKVIYKQFGSADEGLVEVFVPASISNQSVLIYRITDGTKVVAGKFVR